jgi:hypothetical protein
VRFAAIAFSGASSSPVVRHQVKSASVPMGLEDEKGVVKRAGSKSESTIVNECTLWPNRLWDKRQETQNPRVFSMLLAEAMLHLTENA